MTHNHKLELSSGPSRRTALKSGLAVGGAALWVVPAVQALSVTAAAAQDTSVIVPPPPPPPPPPSGKIVSHGFLLLSCKGKYYGVKVEGSSGELDSAGNQDKDYLVAMNASDNLINRKQILNPTDQMLIEFGHGFTVYENENALYITITNVCEAMVAAVAFDGSFADGEPGAGTSDKFAPATIVGNTAYFRQSDNN